MTQHMMGDSDILLFEFHALTEKLLYCFHEHGQEGQVLDEIFDVISDFADKHIINAKGEKKDD